MWFVQEMGVIMLTNTELEVSARDSWVDADKGLVDRRIFSDYGVYQKELTRVFARAWNFVCHDSQLPEPGKLLSELHW